MQILNPGTSKIRALLYERMAHGAPLKFSFSRGEREYKKYCPQIQSIIRPDCNLFSFLQ